MTKEPAKYPSRINEKDEVDVILSPSGWNWTSHANEISLMFFLFVAFSCHCFYYDLKFICFLLLSTFLLLFSPLALVPNYHSKLHVYACLSLSLPVPPDSSATCISWIFHCKAHSDFQVYVCAILDSFAGCQECPSGWVSDEVEDKSVNISQCRKMDGLRSD